MESNYHDKEYILIDKFSFLDFEKTTYDANSYFWGILPEFLSSGIDAILKNTIWRLDVHVGDPQRGDVVVITPHVDKNREYYIKRVIGLPGDTIYFSKWQVYIKKTSTDEFVPLNEQYLSLSNSWHTYLPEYVEGDQFLIPEDSYWVMGDNRNNSADSRSCFRNCSWEPVSAHFLKRKDVVWKVLLNFWYFNIFGDGWLLKSGNLKWTYPPRFLDHPRSATYTNLE
jgi:signal peptidase I